MDDFETAQECRERIRMRTDRVFHESRYGYLEAVKRISENALIMVERGER